MSTYIQHGIYLKNYTVNNVLTSNYKTSDDKEKFRT
jgi:hypothetical protein